MTIVVLDQTGKVTGVTAGTATITVDAEVGVAGASCLVTVNEVNGIELLTA